jgi:non-heme chloroperoxidase
MIRLISCAVVAALLTVATSAKAELTYTEIEGYGGVPLNVIETGNKNGPDILLIHGFGQGSLAFRLQLLSDLADDFHLVAFDLRGHGLSGKPWQADLVAPSEAWAGDVAAVIAATGLEKPVIVGWSYGGFVISDYVRHFGTENIAGINMVGSLGGLVPRSPFPQTEISEQLMENSRKSRSLVFDENVEAALNTAMSFYTPNMDDQDKQAQFAMGLLMPSYVKRAMAGRDLDNVDIADQFDVPVLLTRGSRDMVMPANDTEVALQTLQDAKLSFYDDTGHLPFYHHPERFNQELADFVRQVTAD